MAKHKLETTYLDNIANVKYNKTKFLFNKIILQRHYKKLN